MAAAENKHQGLLDFIERRGIDQLELTNEEIATARTGAFADTLVLSHAMRSVKQTITSLNLANTKQGSLKNQDLDQNLLKAKMADLQRQLLSDWYLRLFSALELPELLASIAMESTTLREMNQTFDPSTKGMAERSKLLLNESVVQSFWAEAAPHLAVKMLEATRAEKSFTQATSTGKFSQDLQLGSTATFYLGLDGVIGLPRLKFLEAIQEEHTSREPFSGFNQGRPHKTTPEAEFKRVLPNGILAPISTLDYTGTVDCCEPWGIQDFEEHPRAKQAKLLKAEIVALRLYTSPMYMRYNVKLRELLEKYLELRGQRAGGSGAEVSAEEEAETLLAAQKAMKLEEEGGFVTTIHAIASGLIKLSRFSSTQGKVYRGIHGRNLPECFLRPGTSGGRGGVEYGFLSTSRRKEEAIRYASAGGTSDMPIVFEILLGMVDRGADLEWVTLFPGEEEICLPPLSNLELSGLPRYEWIQGAEGTCLVMILPLQVNVNFKGYTLDELEERRKALHIRTFQNLLSEVVRDFRKLSRKAKAKATLKNAVKGGIISKRDSGASQMFQMLGDGSVRNLHTWTESIMVECNKVLEEHKLRPQMFYNDDTRYKSALEEALNTKVQAKFKLEVLMQRYRTSNQAALKEILDAPLQHFTLEAELYPLLSGLRDFPWSQICERHKEVRSIALRTYSGAELTPLQLRLALQCVSAHARAVSEVTYGSCVLHSLSSDSQTPHQRSPSPEAVTISMPSPLFSVGSERRETVPDTLLATARSYEGGREVGDLGMLLGGGVSFGPLSVRVRAVEEEGGAGGGEGRGIEEEVVELKTDLLGGAGGKLVGRLLAGCTKPFIALDLSHSKLFSAGAEELAPDLGQAAPKLTRLNLEHCRLGLKGGFAVVTALQGANLKAMKWLSLRGNALSSDAWVALAGVVRTMSGLVRLDVSYCGLLPDTSKPLLDAIMTLTTLESLDIRGSVLAADAAEKLSELLRGGPGERCALREFNGFDLAELPVQAEAGGTPGAKTMIMGGKECVRVGFEWANRGTVVGELKRGDTFNMKSSSEAIKQALKLGPESCLSLIMDTPQDELDGRDVHGRTSLWRAASDDQEVVVQLLIQLRADVDAADLDGVTPLAVAAQIGGDSVMEVLLAAGADPSRVSSRAKSPLHRAAEKGGARGAGSLLARMTEQDVTRKCGAGLTALHYAAGSGHVHMVERLLEKKALLDEPDPDGRTPLMLAAKWGEVKAVELLLDKGAAIDQKDGKGRTAIMAATGEGHVGVVRVLKKREANLGFRDCMGLTVFDLARRMKRHEELAVLTDTEGEGGGGGMTWRNQTSFMSAGSFARSFSERDKQGERDREGEREEGREGVGESELMSAAQQQEGGGRGAGGGGSGEAALAAQPDWFGDSLSRSWPFDPLPPIEFPPFPDFPQLWPSNPSPPDQTRDMQPTRDLGEGGARDLSEEGQPRRPSVQCVVS